MDPGSLALFEEIQNGSREHIEKMGSILHELDQMPVGTDITSTEQYEALEAQMNTMTSYVMSFAPRVGGSFTQQWQLRVYSSVVESNPDFAARIDKAYRDVYPLLRLTHQQQMRLKLTYDVYKRRLAEHIAERKPLVAAISHFVAEDTEYSMTDRFREVSASENALMRLRCFDHISESSHVMAMLIVFRKILDRVQLARLVIASYPLLPCMWKLFEVVDYHINTSPVDTFVGSAVEEILKDIKPCNHGQSDKSFSSVDTETASKTASQPP